jgi:hypothetical protein
MNASRLGVQVAVGLTMAALASVAVAQNASSTTKINNAKAKAWTDGSIKNQEYQKDIVHFGSKKDGTCDLNIGTVKTDGKKRYGEKAPKNIVVSTKNVINVCK